MGSTARSLLQKELKQNYIIYGLSAIFLAVGIIHRQYAEFVPKNWLQILAFCIPVAFAGAYGFQAFDLEENYRTRDFLLSRPLTVSSIILAKYLCGLLILSVFTIAWILVLLPGMIRFPAFDDFQSFWGSAFLVMVILIYSTSFSTGAFVKGAKKLLLGIVLSGGVLAWFFFCWLKLMSLFYFYPAMTDYPFAAYMAMFLAALGLLLLILSFQKLLVTLFLQNTLWEMGRKPVIIHWGVLILLPLVCWSAAAISQPAIYPFQSLWSSFFSEEWFIASQGAPQPLGDLYALVDTRGRIGLARKNEKPRIIYQGERQGVNQLSQIVWAPDGKKIAFSENGRIKVLSLANRQIWQRLTGGIPFWSADAHQMMIIKKGLRERRGTAANFQIFLADFPQGTVTPMGNLASFIDPLAWDSVHRNILFVDEDWQLISMNIRTRQIQVYNLPIRRFPEKIFFKEIIPPPAGRSVFRVAVFSFNPVFKKPWPYNVYLYDFDSRRNKVSYLSALKGLRYFDLMISPTGNDVSAGLGNGIYRMIPIPAREGR